MNTVTPWLAILVLLVGGCAASEPRGTAGDSPAPPAAEAVPGPEVQQPSSPEPMDKAEWRKQVRCETIVLTGSRIREQFCLTEGDWELWRQQSQEMLRNMQGPRTPGR